MTPLLSLKNLVKSYKVGGQKVTVLNNISFEIEEGDFLIIFGPSGCGKSTLLHILLGLQSPDLGKMIVSGNDIYLNDEDSRSDFRKQTYGMVFQQSNWIKSLSVLENVAFPLMLSGTSKVVSLSKAKEALTELNMISWANYRPDELSSGQQQKVAIARAITTNPKIIVADEPTGNLDRKSGVELMELLTQLNRKGKTIIMVTHDTDYLVYANKAIEMLDGTILNVLGKKDIKKTIIKERDLIAS